MAKMTLQHRYEDIARRCGLSENVVKRVLSAQADSVIDSLKEGESATVPLLCTLKPQMRKGMFVNEGMTERNYIKIKATPLDSLRNRMEQVEKYSDTEDEDEVDDFIRVAQIGSLG